MCGARSILFSPKKESARGCLPFPYTKKEDARGVLLSILMKKKLLYIYFISLLGFCVLIASNATAHYPILEDCFIVLFGILETQAFFLKNFFAFFLPIPKTCGRGSLFRKICVLLWNVGL